jgi:hypothetical protein
MQQTRAQTLNIIRPVSREFSTDIFLQSQRKEIYVDSNIGSYLLSHPTELRLLLAVLSMAGAFAAIKVSLMLIEIAKYVRAQGRTLLSSGSHNNQPSTVGAR